LSHQKRILDLIFSNDLENVSISGCPPLVSKETHHEPVVISFLSSKFEKLNEYSSKFFNFNKTNFDSVISDLNLFDFNVDLKINLEHLLSKYESFFVFDIEKYFLNFKYVKSAPQIPVFT
jgi:hypothetical protein